MNGALREKNSPLPAVSTAKERSPSQIHKKMKGKVVFSRPHCTIRYSARITMYFTSLAVVFSATGTLFHVEQCGF
jgi:hypothetical protein